MRRKQKERDFQAVYDQCFRPIARFVARRVGPNHRDDVVAEVFLTAWRRWDEEPRPSLPWLYVVARNVIFNTLRNEHKANVSEEIEVEAVGDAAESIVRLAHLSDCLDRLRDDDRFVLTLVAWDDLDATEAAEVLGCSVSTFYVRLHRARMRLEKLIDSEDAYWRVERSNDSRWMSKTTGEESK